MKNISKILSRFIYKHIGMKYGLNSSNEMETDCFKMLEDYLSFFDKKFPDEFGEYSRENYGEKFLADGKEAMQTFLLIINNVLTRSDEKNVIGDVLIFADAEGIPAVGIDCGNGHVFTVSASNGCVIEKRNNFTLLEVYKCQQQSQ